MARHTTVTLVDDLDSTKNADETVTFGIDGATYEIDLSAMNAAGLRKVLEKYVTAGRLVAKARRRRGSAAPGVGQQNLAAIRAWAKDNGYEVSNRGRVSAEIQRAYDAAQAAPQRETKPRTTRAKKNQTNDESNAEPAFSSAGA